MGPEECCLECIFFVVVVSVLQLSSKQFTQTPSPEVGSLGLSEWASRQYFSTAVLDMTFPGVNTGHKANTGLKYAPRLSLSTMAW